MFLKNNILFLKSSKKSYRELSEFTNITQTTLKDIASGINQNPKLDVLIKLSKAFNISIDDLIFKDLSSGK